VVSRDNQARDCRERKDRPPGGGEGYDDWTAGLKNRLTKFTPHAETEEGKEDKRKVKSLHREHKITTHTRRQNHNRNDTDINKVPQ